MFDTSKLAVILVTVPSDKHLVDGVLADIRTSLFNQKPTFLIVEGTGAHNDLTAALNAGIEGALTAGCDYVFWAHNDMQFNQPNWHIPLIRRLDQHSTLLKVCAHNTRDELAPLRLGQEQSWMMRTADFKKYKWLWFDTRFKGIGGYEDWYQSWQIISRGKLVLIDPASQVFHQGMQTRKLRDTNDEQRKNNHTYRVLVGNDEEPHQWKFFGSKLNRENALKALSKVQIQFPEFVEKGPIIL